MTIRIEFSVADTNYVVRTYNNGTGLAALAEEFDVAVSTIRRVLLDEGVTLRGRGRPVGS